MKSRASERARFCIFFFFFSFHCSHSLSLPLFSMSSPFPSTARESSARGSALVVRNLTARAGGTPILEDISFTLKSGQRRAANDGADGNSSTPINGSIAFVRGPSGGGKTALLRTVASLEPVDEVRGLIEWGSQGAIGRDEAARRSFFTIFFSSSKKNSTSTSTTTKTKTKKCRTRSSSTA